MFRRSAPVTLAAAFIVLLTTAQARDTLSRFPINDALQTPAAKEKVDATVKLYFGAHANLKPAKTIETGARTNKKTNFFNKTDKEGCEWAFLSAILTLQAHAKQLGGNAVINIKSITNTDELMSDTEYLCRAGNVTGGVALVGDVVTL